MPWSAEFDDPIELPKGRTLTTLKDAANYIKLRNLTCFRESQCDGALAAGAQL